jgi:hypothetical protein
MTATPMNAPQQILFIVIEPKTTSERRLRARLAAPRFWPAQLLVSQ